MKLQSFMDAKMREYRRIQKSIKKKAFFLKARIFFTCILPVIIILLTVKVVQTLVRLEVRKAAASVKAPVKKAVTQTTEKPEFITPVPVNNEKK